MVIPTKEKLATDPDMKLESIVSNGSSDLTSLELPPNLADQFKSDSSPLNSLNNNQEESLDLEGEEKMSLEDSLAGAQRAFYIFVNNQYMEGYKLLDKHHKSSFYHSLGKSLALSLRYLFTLKEEYHADAYESIYYTIKKINKLRHKRTNMETAASYLYLKNTYATYTDEECHAELTLAEIYATNALITITHDQTIGGYVKAAMRIRTCYNLYLECEKILKNKPNWCHQDNRIHFESGVLAGLGIFEMAISFLPSKLIKVLEMAGFRGNRTFGINQLIAGEKLSSGIRYPIISIALSAYFGFVEFFYGLGEPDEQVIFRILDFWSQNSPQSVTVSFGNAFKEQTKGNFINAIKYYDEFCTGQQILRSFHHISNWQKMWIHSLTWDWRAAASCSKAMLDKCKWSPSLFAFIHASHLSMIADEESDKEVKENLSRDVIKYIEQAILKKKNFGSRNAFHEKLVSERAKYYFKFPAKIVLMPFDLIYCWNYFKIGSANPDCLPLIMSKIEEKLSLIKSKDNDLESWCYLTFMKGVVFEHSGCPLMAVDCFYDVLNEEKNLEFNYNLVPQSCFEIAQIYRRSGDLDEARTWYKKSKSYSNYVTETMIKFRVQMALTLMKNL